MWSPGDLRVSLSDCLSGTLFSWKFISQGSKRKKKYQIVQGMLSLSVRGVFLVLGLFSTSICPIFINVSDTVCPFWDLSDLVPDLLLDLRIPLSGAIRSVLRELGGKESQS